MNPVPRNLIKLIDKQNSEFLPAKQPPLHHRSGLLRLLNSTTMASTLEDKSSGGTEENISFVVEFTFDSPSHLLWVD